jgi:hypothetical protein
MTSFLAAGPVPPGTMLTVGPAPGCRPSGTVDGPRWGSATRTSASASGKAAGWAFHLPVPVASRFVRDAGHSPRAAGPARRQRTVAQHHICGHDLGQARDGHRPAAAVRAEQADSRQPDGRLRPAGPIGPRCGSWQRPHRRDRGGQRHRRDRAQQTAPPPRSPSRPQRQRPRSATMTAASGHGRRRGAGAPGGRSIAAADCHRSRPGAGTPCGA